MSVVLLVFLLVVVPFMLGLYGDVRFRRKAKRKKNTWRLEPIVVSAVRPNQNNAQFDGVRFQARKRNQIMAIDTPWAQTYALDPASSSFHEGLAEYRAVAKEVVQALNANDRLLES